MMTCCAYRHTSAAILLALVFIGHFDIGHGTVRCDIRSCGGDCHSSEQGSVVSPGYPSSYPPSEDCYYYISSSQITLTEYQFEGSCKYDYIKIYDGKGGSMINQFCNSSTGHTTLSSPTGQFYIHFHSDFTDSGRGFRATWGASNHCNLSSCGGSCVGDGGWLMSPGYPALYPTDQDCVYTIARNNGQTATLRFSYFNLEGGRDDCFDYIEIFAGSSASGRRLGKFCGADIPDKLLQSDDGRFYIHFHSDSSMQGKFKARWGDVRSLGGMCEAGGGRCISTDIACTESRVRHNAGCREEDASTPVCCREYFRLVEKGYARDETSGDDSVMGLVEVLHEGQWGTVCEKEFDQGAADTICRSINRRFVRAKWFKTAMQFSDFLIDDIKVWIGKLLCQDWDTTIDDCSVTWNSPRSGWGCTHDEDVVLRCTSSDISGSSYAWFWALIPVAVLVLCCYCCCKKNKEDASRRNSTAIPQQTQYLLGSSAQTDDIVYANTGDISGGTAFSESFGCGLGIFITNWNGSQVVGGIKILHNDDSIVSIGNTSHDLNYAYSSLEPPERIVSGQVRSGWLIDAINLTTTGGRRLGHGGQGGALRPEEVRPGYVISGIKGYCVRDRGKDVIYGFSFIWSADSSLSSANTATAPELAELLPSAHHTVLDPTAPPAYTEALNYPVTDTPSTLLPEQQESLPPRYEDVSHIKS